MANPTNKALSPGSSVVNGGSTPMAMNGLVQNGTSSSHPASNGKVRRKQWVLHDGPHGSLQRLRLRMAEEGCGHSQVALAKQFLLENSGESDQLAIHWLLKAADQGHYEGLELLKSCFDSNRGITENNCHKIRSFLDMSQHERAARLGAKTLFTNMAQGSDFITTKQLEEWLEESFARQRLSQDPAESSPSPSDRSVGDLASSLVLGGELLSEQHLTSAASVYASGHFPPLLRLLDLGSKQRLAYFYHWLTHGVLNLFIHSFSPSLLFCVIVAFTALNNPLQAFVSMHISTLAVLLFWIMTLAAAAVFSAKSCRLVRDWNEFRGWSLLLSHHAQQLLEPAIPEQLYVARAFPSHFARLFLAALPCVSLQPALQLIRSSLPQPGLWLPFGELGVLASLLCSTCFDCRFGLGFDDLLCVVGWLLLRIQSAPWGSYYPAEHGGETEPEVIERFQMLHPALTVRFPLMAVVGLLILVPLYTRKLRRFDHLSHLMAWSLSHFASLVWLFLAIDWLQQSTLDGVLRGLIFSVAAILLRSNCNWLTKANLLLCCVTSYSSGSAIGLTSWIALGLAVCFIAVTRASTQLLTLTSQRLSSLLVRRPLVYVWTAFKGALTLACLAILAFRLMEYLDNKSLTEDAIELAVPPSTLTAGRVALDDELMPEADGSSISWERYRTYCVPPSPAKADSSVAVTQLACSALDGVAVHWEGVVRQVSIDSRHNWAESFLRWLPPTWSEWISCRLGEKYSDCHYNTPQSIEHRRCHYLWQMNKKRGRHCHLERYSKFTFRFEVEPKLPNETILSALFESKMTVELVASQRFHSIGLRLTPGHLVRFHGILSTPSVGSLKPQLELTAIECVSCQPESEHIFPGSSQQSPGGLFQTSTEAIWPDFRTFATGAFQGTTDFVLPYFIRLNVTQLWS